MTAEIVGVVVPSEEIVDDESVQETLILNVPATPEVDDTVISIPAQQDQLVGIVNN
jgi:hypothetical protein